MTSVCETAQEVPGERRVLFGTGHPGGAQDRRSMTQLIKQRPVRLIHMKTKLLILLCLPWSLHAADVPAQPLAKMGALIFSDEFSAPDVSKAWRIISPTFTIAEGALKASQTVKRRAVGMVPVRRKDLLIEFKFRFGRSPSINAACNGRDYKEGHICRVFLGNVGYGDLGCYGNLDPRRSWQYEPILSRLIT